MKGHADNLIQSSATPRAEQPPSRTWQIHFAQGELVKAAIAVERGRENLRKDRSDANQIALTDAELKLSRVTQTVMKLTDYST